TGGRLSATGFGSSAGRFISSAGAGGGVTGCWTTGACALGEVATGAVEVPPAAEVCPRFGMYIAATARTASTINAPSVMYSPRWLFVADCCAEMADIDCGTAGCTFGAVTCEVRAAVGAVAGL